MTDLEQALAAGGKPAQPEETDLQKALRAGGQPQQTEAPKPGFFRRAYETVKGGAQAVGRVYKDQADLEARAVLHPQQTFGTPEGRAQAEKDFILTNPSKRREFERGVSDVVTLGYANPLIKDTEEADAAEAPDYRAAGNVAGSFLPSPVSIIGKGAGAVIGKGLPQATSIAGKTAVNIAKGLGTYEATAPLVAGASAGASGDRLGAARRAATDPAGLLMSGGIPAVTTPIAETVGATGRATARHIRDPRGEVGRGIADVEAVGGKLHPLGGPSGGFYDTEKAQSLPLGKAGYNSFADEKAQAMNARHEGRLADLRSGFNRKMESYLAPIEDDYQIVDNAMEKLHKLRADNEINGVVGNRELHGALNDVQAMLTSNTADMGPSAGSPRAPLTQLTPSIPAEARAIPSWINPATGKPYPGSLHGSMERTGGAPNARAQEAADHVADETVREWGSRNSRGNWTSGGETEAAAGRGKTVPQAQWDLGGAKTEPNGRAVVSPGAPEPETPVDLPAIKTRDLLKVKRFLNDRAEWGMPKTPENVPYRMLSGVIGDELERIDPRIAGLNKHYATEMSKLERENDIVYGKDRASVGNRAAPERRAALFLGRAGDETQAATGASARHLDEVAAMTPENGQDIREIRGMKARERFRYGSPKVSMAIERIPTGWFSKNADAVTARVALPAAEALGRVKAPGNPVANFPAAVRIGVEAKRKKEKEQR